MVRAHVEHVNQSASCSQDVRKRSGCTGSGETDINTNTMVALESGNESSVQNCYNNGLDSDRSRREAALMKFRMKRKDRCFEKKVFNFIAFFTLQISIECILYLTMPSIFIFTG